MRTAPSDNMHIFDRRHLLIEPPPPPLPPSQVVRFHKRQARHATPLNGQVRVPPCGGFDRVHKGPVTSVPSRARRAQTRRGAGGDARTAALN